MLNQNALSSTQLEGKIIYVNFHNDKASLDAGPYYPSNKTGRLAQAGVIYIHPAHTGVSYMLQQLEYFRIGFAHTCQVAFRYMRYKLHSIFTRPSRWYLYRKIWREE